MQFNSNIHIYATIEKSQTDSQEEWTAGELNSKHGKNYQGDNKVIAPAFLDAHRIIFYERSILKSAANSD